MDLQRFVRNARWLLDNRLQYVRNVMDDPYAIENAPVREHSFSAEMQEFLDRNDAFWDEFLADADLAAERKVLIDATPDDVEPLVIHCTLGTFLAREKGLEPVFVVIDNYEKKRVVIETFCDGTVVPIGRSSFTNRSLLQTAKTVLASYPALESVDDVFDIAVDGVPIGDLVYSSAIRNSGEGTFETFDATLFFYLLDGIVKVHNYQPIFDRFDVEVALCNHPLYIDAGVLARVAIANGAEFFSPDLYRFERFTSMEHVRSKPGRPTRELVDHITDHYEDEAIRTAEELIADRFGVDPRTRRRDRPEPDGASSEFGFDDPSRPTLLVLPHIFIEHLRGTEELLFRDYLTWFRRILEFATRHRDRNWIIKLHPNRDCYPMHQTVPREVESIVGTTRGSNIALVDEDYSRASLVDATDLLLTVDGTAGLEYTCYGIPVLLACESPYSGFGFTHRPRTRSAYFDALTDPATYEPLSDEQVARAKVLAYIHFDLIRDPWPSYKNIDRDLPEGVRAKRFLRKVRANTDSLRRDLHALVANDRRHMYSLPCCESDTPMRQPSSSSDT